MQRPIPTGGNAMYPEFQPTQIDQSIERLRQERRAKEQRAQRIAEQTVYERFRQNLTRENEEYLEGKRHKNKLDELGVTAQAKLDEERRAKEAEGLKNDRELEETRFKLFGGKKPTAKITAEDIRDGSVVPTTYDPTTDQFSYGEGRNLHAGEQKVAQLLKIFGPDAVQNGVYKTGAKGMYPLEPDREVAVELQPDGLIKTVGAPKLRAGSESRSAYSQRYDDSKTARDEKLQTERSDKFRKEAKDTIDHLETWYDSTDAPATYDAAVQGAVKAYNEIDEAKGYYKVGADESREHAKRIARTLNSAIRKYRNADAWKKNDTNRVDFPELTTEDLDKLSNPGANATP